MNIIKFIVLFLCVVIMRLNLPDNEINKNLAIKNDANVVEEFASKIAFSNVIADWNLIDLIVVKFACSERLGLILVAYPFSKWELWDNEVKSCGKVGA